MTTNQCYWLLMVKIELSDRLKLIKHQMKIIQATDNNNEVDQALGSEVHSNQRTKMTSNQDFKLKHQVKILKLNALVHFRILSFIMNHSQTQFSNP